MDAHTYGQLVEHGGTVRLSDVSAQFVERLLASGPNPYWWPRRQTPFGTVTIAPADWRPRFRGILGVS